MKLLTRAKSFLLIFVTLLLSCTNSDDYIFDESDATPIQVSAYMTSAFDPTESQVKCDTVSPTDSVIFIANVSPSKSIRTKKYYWTIDGNPLASEFSFRSAIDSPGKHNIAFILIDYFGDTLSDTLQLWVQNAPVINTSNVIPENMSNGMPTHGGVNFAWTAYDPDSTYELTYRFTLKQFSKSHDDDIIVDTSINTSYFTYWGDLDLFTRYTWQVKIKNDQVSGSDELFSNTFYTGGSKKESAIMGSTKGYTLDVQNLEDTLFYRVQLQDTANNIVASDSGKEVCTKYFKYRFSPIKPGMYTLSISIPSHPEYTEQKLNVNLVANEVLDGQSILSDSIPPSITALSGSGSDTLLFADTLHFIVQDNGLPIRQNLLEVGINGKPTDLYDTHKDTLVVYLPPSHVTQLLSVKAKDIASNKASKTFIVKAGTNE